MPAADHLKSIRERHHSTVRHWFRHSTTDCAHCLTSWPCDASRLLDAVEAVLRVADALDTIATERSLSARILGPSFKEVARNIREAINGALEKP